MLSIFTSKHYFHIYYVHSLCLQIILIHEKELNYIHRSLNKHFDGII